MNCMRQPEPRHVTVRKQGCMVDHKNKQLFDLNSGSQWQSHATPQTVCEDASAQTM